MKCIRLNPWLHRQTSTLCDQLLLGRLLHCHRCPDHAFPLCKVRLQVLLMTMLTGHFGIGKYSQHSARWWGGPSPTVLLAALPRLRGTICLFSLESVHAWDCQAVWPIPHMCLNTVKHKVLRGVRHSCHSDCEPLSVLYLPKWTTEKWPTEISRGGGIPQGLTPSLHR